MVKRSVYPVRIEDDCWMRSLKFLTDGMLGKLTRWLRMLGYDTEYADNLEDKKLVEIAKKEDRILLTRDHELYRLANSKQVNAFLVEDKTRSAQLATLSHQCHLSLKLDPDSSRCPKCNSIISHTEKNSIYEKIPSATARVYSEFWECQNCGKIYWKGAHWKKIVKTLDDACKMGVE